MDPGSMVAAARSALSGLIGVSPTARQRSEIKREVELYKVLKDQGLSDASSRVESLVNLEVDRLFERKKKAFGRSYAWSTLYFGAILAIILGSVAWLLYPPHGMLRVTAFTTVVVLGSLSTLGTIGAFSTARSKDDDTTETP